MEITITSTSNNLVKEVVSLHEKKNREKLGLIILEGEKLVESAINSNVEILKTFSTTPKDNAILVKEHVMKKMATTSSAPKILALAKMPTVKFNQKWNKILLLDNIKDEGNLGTIIRSALAFGFDAIFLYGNSTDEYSPKVLRATVGCSFKMPILRVDFDFLNNLKSNYKFYSTVVSGGVDVSNLKNLGKFILMMGSEAFGLSDNLKNIADVSLTLPMKHNVESLNLAVSSSIFMWEISKI